MYGGSGASPAGSPSRRTSQRPAPDPAPPPGRRGEPARPEPLAGAQTSGLPRQRLPEPVFDELEQEDLDVPPTAAAEAKPGGNHPRVVDDGELACEITGQVGERAMADVARGAPEDEQARGGAALTPPL